MTPEERARKIADWVYRQVPRLLDRDIDELESLIAVEIKAAQDEAYERAAKILDPYPESYGNASECIRKLKEARNGTEQR